MPSTSRDAGRLLRPLRLVAAALIAACLSAPATAGGVLGDVQRSIVATSEVKPVQARTGERPSGGAAATPSVMPEGALKRGVLYQAKLPAVQEQLIKEEFAKRFTNAAAAPVLLPGVLRQEAEDGVDIVLKPLVLVGQALSRDNETGRFIGTILVGVKEISDTPSEGRALTAPVQFDVLETSLATPSRVLVTSSAPNFASIRVTSASPRILKLRVASRFAPEGVEVVVPVEALSLEPSSDVVDAWGLQAADLNIAVVGLANPEHKRVRLTMSGSAGTLESSRLELDKFGEATTRVRSGGMGAMKITASVEGLTATTTVKSRFPALTLIASSLGGLVGGLIQLLSERQQQQQIGRNRALVALAVSLLTGFLIFALYAVGVNVTPVNPTVSVGAVLVFAISGIGAYLGTRLLKFGTT